MALNACKKGKTGEVEFCQWLDENLGLETERNYNQSQGGADIIVGDFIFEVKRREALDLKTWWLQVIVAKKSHKNPDLVPVVCFRQNRKQWEFLIPAAYIGIEKGYVRLSALVFKKFAMKIMNGSDLPLLSAP